LLRLSSPPLLLLPSCSFFFSRPRRPPSSTLFPYTTLFRSAHPLAAKSSGPLPASDSGLRAPPSRGRVNSPGLCIRRHSLPGIRRSEEHTSELQSRRDLVCRLLLEKKKYSLEDCAVRTSRRP